MNNNPKPNTFDNVFRTIAQKMPFMMVALINEAFGEHYPDNVKYTQLRNEFITENGKIITDSIFLIKDKYYHIECQSNPDSTMEIRMIEYDFMIAHEHAKKEKGAYVIRFPESAVLYLRHKKSTPDNLKVIVKMPNGESIDYETKVIKAQNYTKDEIFQKKLLILVPFYLMRYESMFSKMDKDYEKRLSFLKECEDLRIRLEKEVGNKEALYADLINLIIKVSNHMLENHKEVKKGVKDVMGGKVLELSSEKLIKKGRAEGRAEEKNEITKNIRNNLKKQHPDWDEARINAETEMLIKAI
ncbi:MAG: hypothetical protein K6E98_05325 [Lachnospiraceae bacterium]|nr:hypothetical protein [Lachnospiraceae bacterium]